MSGMGGVSSLLSQSGSSKNLQTTPSSSLLREREEAGDGILPPRTGLLVFFWTPFFLFSSEANAAVGWEKAKN